MGDDLQPPTVRERLRKGDEVLFYVPFVGHGITINEFHAHVIGLVTGVLVAASYYLGFEWTAFVVAVLLVGYALFGPPFLRSLPHDLPEYEETVALRTLRWEPWHFLGLFLVGITAFSVVAGVVP